MTYRKNCNYSGQCPSREFCKSSPVEQLQMCNDCPNCGCCMFCPEGMIYTEDFPIFQFNSVNNSIEQKQNHDLFDLEKEIKEIKNRNARNSALQGLMLRTGMIGDIPRISSQSYFKRN